MAPGPQPSQIILDAADLAAFPAASEIIECRLVLAREQSFGVVHRTVGRRRRGETSKSSGRRNLGRTGREEGCTDAKEQLAAREAPPVAGPASRPGRGSGGDEPSRRGGCRWASATELRGEVSVIPEPPFVPGRRR